MSSAPDHFERLGLPRRFALDASELERSYLRRSRELHPDFHQLGSTSEQAASVEMTARLNEAVAILRDPFRRAEYLLSLLGGPSAAEQKEMPAEFLEEILDLRMQIEELNAAHPAGSEQTSAMERQLLARSEALLAEVAAEFSAPLAPDSAASPVLKEIRRKLNAVKYVQNLVRDLRN